ncbi:hypothetical protein GCM10010129_37880 [Streptomyces fumigatiscleroticus]|nr:hypothetical protein GCM10010129_37880 [Streptomyces fumigatiscleroticus]
MHRPPAVRLIVTLSAAFLLAAAACSAGGPEHSRPAPASPAPARSPAAVPSPGATAALTEDQAHAALITPSDLGEPWVPTQGAATWRDELLKSTAERPDCRRLLDVLYTERLFGAARGPHAVTALDDGDDEAQLRYQVIGRPAADADRTLAWLRSLPRTCGRFTAVSPRGDRRGVRVTETPLPGAGDARQGLRVVVSGERADGEPAVLTLDVAAVRVGEDAIGVTDGGLGEVPAEALWTAVELGAQRLTELRRRGRVQV